jgi:hypothetical protein
MFADATVSTRSQLDLLVQLFYLLPHKHCLSATSLNHRYERQGRTEALPPRCPLLEPPTHAVFKIDVDIDDTLISNTPNVLADHLFSVTNNAPK